MQQNVDPSTRQTPLKIQPSIPEEHELVMSGSEESDELSTAQPNNLFNKPPHDSTNQESNNQSDDDTFHSAVSRASYATTDAFAQEFGPMVDHLDTEQLERDRATILQPLLNLDYSKLEVSTITRHMWAHCQNMPFETWNVWMGT